MNKPLLPPAPRRALVCLGLALLTAGGCEDPVLAEKLAALGPEDPAVPPGPLHRPGQPCLVCHAASGVAPRFTAAGTVYRTPAARTPVGGVEVRLIDATRRWFIAHTNCAGNFVVTPGEYEPVMPLWVSLSGLGLGIDMESAMNKDGDCGACHAGSKSPTSAGPVYLTDDPAVPDSAPSSGCGGSRP
jgi:hypothetical protein